MSSNPSERGIRGITRGHLIRTGISAATIGLSPLLSACLVNAEDKARVNAWAKDPSTAPTVIAGLRTPAAGPRPGSPTPRIEPTALPTERPKTLEDQAKEIGFNAWLNLLSSSQEFKGYGGGKEPFFKSEIVNKDWLNSVPGIFKSNTQPNNTPLQVKWVSGTSYSGKSILHGGQPFLQLNKYTGEMQINNVKIATNFNTSLSEIDKLNGFQGRGGVAVQFVVRSHARYYFIVINGPKDTDAALAWLKSQESKPFPDFSDWQQDIFSVGLVLRNDQWQIDLKTYNNLRRKSDGVVSNYDIPSIAISNDRDLFLCATDRGCETIKTEANGTFPSL